MAKLKGPLHSQSASGRLAESVIFRDTKHGPVATRFHKPGSRTGVEPTDAMLRNRSAYGLCIAHWRALSDAERNAFDVLAGPEGISGWNYYLRGCMTGGASFDGVNDYLLRGSDLTGDADSQLGIFAARLRFNDGDGLLQRLLYANGALFDLRKNTTNKIGLLCYTSGVVKILDIRTLSNVTSSSGYINLLIAWDLSIPAAQLYLNDVNNAAVVTLLDDVVDYTRTNWSVSATVAGASKAGIDIDFLYFNNAATINFSIEASRRKFFNEYGVPVLSPTGDGSEVTGTAPIIYLAGQYDQFQGNKGTGGGFDLIGALSPPS